MYQEYERWQRETRLPYDQRVANFYRELNEGDHRLMVLLKISLYGDNRPWPPPKKELQA